MDSEDLVIIVPKEDETLDDLIDAAWKDQTGKATKILAKYIKTTKDQSNRLPEKVLKEMLSKQDPVIKNIEFPEHIRQKLDKIAMEADLDENGWGLIRYIDGYSEILDACLGDTSGNVFQGVLKYFVEKVRSNVFLDKASQELAKTLINDVRYRLSMSSFCKLFPKELHFYTNIIEINPNEVGINEIMLRELLKSNSEAFLLIVIGFTEFLYLIEKLYVNC